jgi:aldehyde:ferredoxin oxidoreductase
VELRQAGLDALVLSGRAERLSYLFIDDGEARVVPDANLAGKGCLEVESYLKRQLGDEHLKVASIGLAGENLVRFACVTADWGRNAGRTGMGAVLGAKNVKALVVRGSKDLPVYDLKRLKQLGNAAYERLRKNPYFEFWQRHGLMSVVDYMNEAGAMPTFNFRDGYFAQAGRINGYQMEARYKIGDTACFGCSMACGNVCLVRDGRYIGTVAEGPEYETACMFGSNVGVDNFACILRANYLCDELGLDTISTGNLIGVVIEGYKEGFLSLEDLDGSSIGWGHEAGILELIEKIAHRRGIGDVLAGGSRAVLETWPHLRPLVSQVKGLEQSAYDARVAPSMALAYGTSDIGAHHTRAWTLARELEEGADWDLETKAELVIYHQTIRPLFDMLGVCRLPWIELGFREDAYADFFQAATGLPMDIEDLLDRSRHIYDVTRMINVFLGTSRKDDYPPPRTFETPVASGPQAGKVVTREEYEKLLDIYYAKRGWDENGVPPRERLRDELQAILKGADSGGHPDIS